MIKRFLFIVTLIAFVFAHLFSQTAKYSNEFMALGLGARGLGMSGTMTAITDDVHAGYWNPAGLLNVDAHRQLGIMHAEYFAGIAKYDYAAMAAKIDASSSAGLSVIRFAIDDIPNTTELIDNDGNINYDKLKSFSAVDFGVLLSYARLMPVEGLSIGANAKIIKRKAGDFAKAWGFGFDFGGQYKYNEWLFGAVLKDATSTFNAWSYTFDDKTRDILAMTGNDVPTSSTEITLPKLILGVGRHFTFMDKFTVTPAFDFDLTTDKKRNVLVKSGLFSIDPHLGLELGYNKIVFLRAGIGNVQKETDETGKKVTTFQMNMGLGVNISNKFSIDYALTDIGNNSIALYSNIFSLRININRKEEN
ncbi:MAG: hypothetical protein BWY70_01335 [Bacteroidetes bacterium ADurb.Bin408]|nr:MAG: hypothetical protein BWY70_01335 [Bacteroidetes bacterium ADurb.Bin408]